MKPPILIDFPESFETERLRIRSPLPGDGPQMHAAVNESLGELTPWMPWPKEHRTVEDSEASVRQGRGPGSWEELMLLLLLGGDTDARREQRAAPDRLGGAEVRDRLLVPHPVHGPGLRDGRCVESRPSPSTPWATGAWRSGVTPATSRAPRSPSAPASGSKTSSVTTSWIRAVTCEIHSSMPCSPSKTRPRGNVS